MPVENLQDTATLLCSACGAQNFAHAASCSTCGVSLTTGSANGAGANSSALRPGTPLQNGQYVLDGVLGQGGFGITYRGHDSALNRAVAIKEFFPFGCTRSSLTVQAADTHDRADYEASRTRFVEEARVLARFRHAGIVDVYTAFEENNTAYMVMEYLPGRTLLQLVETHGKLTEGEAVGLIARVGEALAIVHEGGLLHRDLKPQNMILRDDGSVVLIDFGTARAFARDTTRRMTTTVTPGYAPLEQYGQQARFGAFTDIYALGATLYHLLTGQPPVQAPDRASGVELTAPRHLNPQISARVNNAVLWALQTNVKERPQSVRDFLDRLTAAKPEAALNKNEARSANTPRDFAEPVKAPQLDVAIPRAGESIAQMQLRREQEINSLDPEIIPPLLSKNTVVGHWLWRFAGAIWVVVFALCFFGLWLLWNLPARPTTVSITSAAPPITTVIGEATQERAYIEDVIPLKEITPGQYYPLKFTPDGSRVVGAQPRQTLQSWDAQTGQRTKMSGTARELLFSPDGKWITGVDKCTGNKCSEFFMASADDGSRRWSIPAPSPSKSPSKWTCSPAMAQTAPVSSGSESKILIAIGSSLMQTVLYNSRGKRVKVLGLEQRDHSSAYVQSVTLSSDGRWLAVAVKESEYGLTSTLELWDTHTKKRRWSVLLTSSHVYQLAFSQESLAVLTGGTVTLYKINNGKRIGQIWPNVGPPVTAFKFSPNGKQLVIANDWIIGMYEADRESEPVRRYLIYKYQYGAEIIDIAFTPDAKSVLLLTHNPPAVHRWKLK